MISSIWYRSISCIGEWIKLGRTGVADGMVTAGVAVGSDGVGVWVGDGIAVWVGDGLGVAWLNGVHAERTISPRKRPEANCLIFFHENFGRFCFNLFM